MTKSGPSIPVFLVLILFSGFLILVGRSLTFQPLYSGVQIFVRPFAGPLQQLRFSLQQTWATLVFFQTGEERIKKLELKTAALQSQLVDYQDLKLENQLLKTQLEVKTLKNSQFILADVIGFSEYLLLNAGASSGLKIGQKVVFQNIYLGQIIDVQKNSSKVRLPTHPQSKISVKTLSGPQGLAIGQFGAGLNLEQIPQKERLVSGDLVVTLTEGLLVGEISEIESISTSTFQKAKIKPSIDYKNLVKVFVILD